MKIEVIDYGSISAVPKVLRRYDIVLVHYPNPPGTYAFCLSTNETACAVLTNVAGADLYDQEDYPSLTMFNIPGKRAHEIKDTIWDLASEVYS